MKNVFFIFAILFSLSVKAQNSEYTFENRGLNIFLDIDGTANKNFQLGGPTFIIGCQANPNFFIGGGASWKCGCIKSEYYNSRHHDIYWRSPEGKDIWDYYVNEKGDTLSNPYRNFDDEWGWLDELLVNWDLLMNVRYNFLPYSRQTPYVDFRLALPVFQDDQYVFSSNILFGDRIALKHGDRALNIAAGYSIINFDTEDLGWQGSFMLRLGFEF